MKRGAYEVLKVDAEKRRKGFLDDKMLLLKWIGLVQDFRGDARDALLRNYELLTNTRVEGAVTFFSKDSTPEGVLLEGPAGIYIYIIDNTLYYGDAVPYPVADKTLWPWTARTAPVPKLTLDIATLLSRYMKRCDIGMASCVSKEWHRCFTSDNVWQYHPLPYRAFIKTYPVPPKVKGNLRLKHWFLLQDVHVRDKIFRALFPKRFKIEFVVMGHNTNECDWYAQITFSNCESTCIISQRHKSLKIFVSWGGYNLKAKNGATFKDILSDYIHHVQCGCNRPRFFRNWHPQIQ
jgi:hypothetical protein